MERKRYCPTTLRVIPNVQTDTKCIRPNDEKVTATFGLKARGMLLDILLPTQARGVRIRGMTQPFKIQLNLLLGLR